MAAASITHFRESLRVWMAGPAVFPTAFALGFLESSIIFTPVEPLMIPVLASRRKEAWLIAACMAVGSVCGGALLYLLGALLSGPVIEPLVAWLNAEDAYARAAEELRTLSFWQLVLATGTPIPFQLEAAAAGAIGYVFAPFLTAIVVARGIRYSVLTILVLLVGARAGRLADKYQLEIFIGGLALFAALAIYLVIAR
ncbi:MAG: VTT domain-containing protein [Hyphomonadaceae bacterium]|nr:VTT domain-containing protein [Hyphomonadaceae bacterium]